MSRARPSPWIYAAVVCAAMLILPALALLFAPRPSAAPRPPRAVETASADPREDDPKPRAARTARAVVSASAAPADATPVTGTVVDPDGKPAARAFVACDDRDQGLTASSDENGQFRLPPEAAGCLAVASHPLFLTSDRTALRAGARNVIRLEREGGIEGEVVDDTGAVITDFDISIESYQGPSSDVPQGRAKTVHDERGAFRWDALAPGAYVLAASAEGRAPARSRAVDVEKGRVTRHVRVVIPRGATLHGRVLDADSKRPVVGARVVFDGITSAGIASSGTNTDDKGAYALPGAPPGPFSIRIVAEGYMTKIITGLYARTADVNQPDALLRLRADGGPQDEMGGIGAMLAPTASGVRIGGVFGGGPAQRAGLLANDRILRIDGEDATGMSLADCVQRLRGADGSIVAIKVERDGKTLDFNVVRSVISR